MNPGDPIIHKPTGKRMTVTAVNGGNNMVLCGWIEHNAQNEPVECSGAFDWQELRYPTEEEKAGKETNPPADATKAPPAETKPAASETQPPAPTPSDAQRIHKRKQSA